MPSFESFYECATKTEVVKCSLNPTDVLKTQSPWLWARNDKYDEDTVDYRKVGKWMLFVSTEQVNSVWIKIKNSIQTGILWHAKVSTSDPRDPKHAIMIYTKDFGNIQDIVNVLNHLEELGVKSRETVIRYKTDEQTRAGIYRGGNQKPWIYESHTVKQLLLA